MTRTKSNIRLGIIGYGFRIRHMISIMKTLGNITIVSICDTNLDATKTNAKKNESNYNDIRFFDSHEKLVNGPQVDGVLLGTNCSTHTPIAIKVLDAGIPLFLEKPVSINDEQLNSLKQAAKKPHKVVVSFPLRLTPLVQKVKEIIDRGTIGAVEHVQAFNDVPYGHVYFQGWYRDNNETGGLFLQKATHDFDYINYLVKRAPVKIAAMTSKQVYKGTHPEGLFCRDCPENKTCRESPYNPDMAPAEDEWMKPHQYMCAFAPDAANEDSGSAIIMYDSGMHAVYSQNFFAKHKAARRGARLYGCDGTIEFDGYGKDIKLYYHNAPKSETIKVNIDASDAHGGGDNVLAQNFIDVINGSAESKSTLKEGILSAEMCLRARRSAQTGTFQNITYAK
ncbi:MAG: Gfo/Idh/MocA family oxidoreductase [Planctomycetota bacterium]